MLPRSDAAPSASVIVNPEARSPDLRVKRFRAASSERPAEAGLPAAGWAADAGNTIDCRYQYFAKNRGLKSYWPGVRLRSVNAPSLSGAVCVAVKRNDCA